MLQEKGWSAGGGDRRRLLEVYVIQANVGVSLACNGDLVPVQLDVVFLEKSCELAVAELAY